MAGSGSETRKRTRPLTIRLDAQEREELERRAEAAGVSLAAYVREKCLGGSGPRSRRRPAYDRDELIRLLGQAGKIGSNVNQIARHLNQGGRILHNHIEEALSAVEVISRKILIVLSGGNDYKGQEPE